ncbi:MAG: hypothetical protein HC906_16560 [Bacteroidales bacterium]|nr:hypothetical protein [Bacteroidales bacterium]
MLQKRFVHLPLKEVFIEKHDLWNRYSQKHFREKLLYLAERQCQKVDHPHVPQRLEYSYAAAAQYGIQYRYPLLDPDLVQTCISYPSWLKHQPHEDRYLFRQAIQNIVPEEIRTRADKSGTVIPHIHIRLINDKNRILNFIESCSDDEVFSEIFDFGRFPEWLNALTERNKEDLNYLMPGAFYNHIMMLLDNNFRNS